MIGNKSRVKISALSSTLLNNDKYLYDISKIEKLHEFNNYYVQSNF